MTTQIALRLPDELVNRIDALVPQVHDSRSDAIRRSIELYLYRLECERDADRYDRDPMSDEELTLADDPVGWSATPAWLQGRSGGRRPQQASDLSSC